MPVPTQRNSREENAELRATLHRATPARRTRGFLVQRASRSFCRNSLSLSRAHPLRAGVQSPALPCAVAGCSSTSEIKHPLYRVGGARVLALAAQRRLRVRQDLQRAAKSGRAVGPIPGFLVRASRSPLSRPVSAHHLTRGRKDRLAARVRSPRRSPRFRPGNAGTNRVKSGRRRQTSLVFIGFFCRAFPSHGRGRRFNPYSAHHRSLQPSAHALSCAKGPPRSGQRTGAA